MAKHRVPLLREPVISAVFEHWQLTAEQCNLNVEAFDSGGDSQGKARVEFRWNASASLGEREGMPLALVLLMAFDVKAFKEDTGAQLATYSSQARVSYQVSGVSAEMDVNHIPQASVAPYMMFAAQLLRSRCEEALRAMGIPVSIPPPTKFSVVKDEPKLSETHGSRRAAQRGKRRKPAT